MTSYRCGDSEKTAKVYIHTHAQIYFGAKIE